MVVGRQRIHFFEILAIWLPTISALAVRTLPKVSPEQRLIAKRELLNIFGASTDSVRYDKVLASPGGASLLKTVSRTYGAETLEALESENGESWPIRGDYKDFVTDPSRTSLFNLSQRERVMESTFQSPLTSFLYERGWRQAFNANGFPGIDKEFEEVVQHFEPVEGPESTVVDLSCGSGLMTRRLVKSGRYGKVIAADLSPAMLGETASRFRREKVTPPELLRCDVSKLPLRSDSVSAIHAGAALHCWSDLSGALSEVYRCLQPGGKSYFSTFLTSAVFGGSSNRLGQQGFHFFTLEELEKLMKEAGFTEVSVTQSGRACAIVKCTKAT